jgi:Family of unknown function (DUF6644)
MSLLPLFKWIEATSVAVTINNSKYAFALLESVHILALAIIGGAVLIVDLRLFGVGFKNQPVASVARTARPWLVGSLIVILTTGLLMFSSLAASKYYYNAAYWYKMYFLLAAIVFTFAVRQPYALRESTQVPSITAKAVALVSIFLWLTVAVMGRAIGFI